MGMEAMLKVLTAAEYAALKEDPNSVGDMLLPEDCKNPFEGQFDLDKCWHELHFLLTGTLEPDGTLLGDAILGGAEIGPDLGYGRARLVSPERVLDIFGALKMVEFTELCYKVDRLSPMICEVYAGSGLRGDLDYLESPFRVLVDAYRTAACSETALLSYLT